MCLAVSEDVSKKEDSIMKSFYKISFLAAGCLIAIGLIFGLVGTAFGGNRQLRDMARDGELSYSIDGWNFADHFINNNILWWFDDEYEERTEHMAETTYPADGIKKLSLKIGAAEVKVMPYSKSGEFMISTNYLDRFEYGISDSDTFFIHSKGNIRNRNWNPKIELYVPENMKFEDVVVDIGAGVADMYALNCKNMDIQVGAGECIGDRIIVGDLKCDIGVGTVTLSDVKIGKSDFEIGMGSADILGKISGDTDIRCNMGSVNMELEGNMEDYNYEVSCAAGNVTIDDEMISVASGSRDIDNQSDVTFDVECSMGNINIEF